MNKELLKKAIISCYQGETAVDNGENRGGWDHRDFTEEEKGEIAEDIIKEYEYLLSCCNDSNLVLSSPEDKATFFNAIENPPAPNDKMKDAMVKYRKFVEDNK